MQLIPFSRVTLAGVLLSMMLPVFAASSPVEGTQGSSVVSGTKVFELKLGASRIIYHTDSAGAEVSVTNPQEYPILVQGKVYAEDKKTIAPFVVPPPLSRLEANQQSRLRIIRTGGSADGNRETLQWFCVAGIPPQETDVWAQDKNAVKEQVTAWQNRPLDALYPIVYLDCIVVKVRHSGSVIIKTVFLALGINTEGQKELLGMWLAENEGAKFWLSVLTELKNRGLEDT
ncbi:Capsule protein fraction 1 [Serratia grimesii]|nr:hypothetical protein 348p1_00059 [Serratia grimesii]CAI2793739.1 Capsule protein fraction 1 [Serratia grimesii]